MAQNYLKAPESPQINAFLAAAGWNLKKMMIKLKNDTPVGGINWLQNQNQPKNITTPPKSIWSSISSN